MAGKKPDRNLAKGLARLDVRGNWLTPPLLQEGGENTDNWPARLLLSSLLRFILAASSFAQKWPLIEGKKRRGEESPNISENWCRVCDYRLPSYLGRFFLLARYLHCLGINHWEEEGKERERRARDTTGRSANIWSAV